MPAGRVCKFHSGKHVSLEDDDGPHHWEPGFPDQLAKSGSEEMMRVREDAESHASSSRTIPLRYFLYGG